MERQLKTVWLTLGCLVVGCRYDSGGHNAGRLVGVWHTVESADTIASIANQYHADQEKILELNDLTGDRSLKTRKEIFIPKESGELPGAGYKERLKKEEKRDIDRVGGEGETSEGRQCDGDNGCLSWPVRGEVIRAFGKHGSGSHDGIDIAAEDGQTVVAPQDGVVIYSGNEISGYGNMVILRHSNGMITVYAHNKVNIVNEGDKIKEAQPIAEVGKTGSATRPHLHFELRINERTVDPIKYLQRQGRR